jgi:glycine oxidase
MLIVGGGVIGLSIARELHRLGVDRITVVDRGRLGREASHAAAGMLAPNAECEAIDEFYKFCDESRLMFRGLASELFDETGIDIELDRSGTLYAAFAEEDSAHLDKRFGLQKAAGIPVDRLSAGETLNAEPAISPDVRGSLSFPNDWQVENRKLLNALIQYVKANRIEAIEGLHIDSLIVEGERVCGAVAGTELLRADVTVLATGAWTSFIKISGKELPFTVKPIRGQMISYRPVGRPFRRIIYSPRGYLVPRADGRILIGATVEDVGFEDGTTDEAVRQLSEAAVEIAPFLANEPIAQHWSGLRPFAAGGLPIIGPLPGHEQLFAATAHYRNGILLAPLTARLIADLIVNGNRSRYFDRFGPDSAFDRGLNAMA